MNELCTFRLLDNVKYNLHNGCYYDINVLYYDAVKTLQRAIMTP